MKKVITKRIVKLFIEGKHRKSFPVFMGNLINKIPTEEICKMSKGMRLTDADCKIASNFIFQGLVNIFLEDLKKEEKYIFELTQNNPIEGVRKVNERGFNTRFELCFTNNYVKVKCPEHLYKFAINKLPTVNLNY